MDVRAKQLLFKNLRGKFYVACIRFRPRSSQPLCRLLFEVGIRFNLIFRIELPARAKLHDLINLKIKINFEMMLLLV